MGWTIGVLFLAGVGIFFLCHHVQISHGAHPASYPMGTGALLPGVKWPGYEADDSPPSSPKVKNA